MMGQEEAASAGPVPSLSRRRGKTPKKRTGKVRPACPASASRAGAIRRANRAGADTGGRARARDTRETGSASRPGGRGRGGNETRWRKGRRKDGA